MRRKQQRTKDEAEEHGEKKRSPAQERPQGRVTMQNFAANFYATAMGTTQPLKPLRDKASKRRLSAVALLLGLGVREVGGGGKSKLK